MAEVWFDAGFPVDIEDNVTELLKELQPGAVAFQGPGENVIRWGGTETGHIQYPFWSAAKSSRNAGPGSIDGSVFAPGEADTTFGGGWFWNGGSPKNMSELISSYHDSVGSNAFWLVDWPPDKNGTLRSDYVARYQEVGDWLRACYGTPVAVVEKPSGTTVTLTLPPRSEVDRVSIQEDQTNGQRVRSYTVTLDGVVAANGTSVGNKRIAMLDGRHHGKTLIVSVEGDAPTLKRVAVFNCSRQVESEKRTVAPNPAKGSVLVV